MEQLAKIEAYIEQNARPLDKACYNFHTNIGSADAVFTELATYQNEDGGLGNALEPDMCQPQPTSNATRLPFSTSRISLKSLDHEMVKRALGYFIQTLDEEKAGQIYMN